MTKRVLAIFMAACTLIMTLPIMTFAAASSSENFIQGAGYQTEK